MALLVQYILNSQFLITPPPDESWMVTSRNPSGGRGKLCETLKIKQEAEKRNTAYISIAKKQKKTAKLIAGGPFLTEI